MARLGDAMKWQPIHTAPKDGTGILLAGAIDADGRPINWHKDGQAQVSVQTASWHDYGDGEGEWIVYCSMIQDPALHFEPTHWMPIPAPPSVPR